ncbi:MAG: GatB/YqeY domain-containing protein [Burkholderiaceae bacterium]|jgi:uncharacterized protein YqeY
MASNSPLAQRITEDMKAAMRAKDAFKLSTIRMLTAAMKQKEVDERVELSDADVLAIVEKLIKQRRDAAAQFEAAGRKDLSDKENAEIALLTGYMPSQLSAAEVEAEIDAVIKESGLSGPQAMGKLMGTLKTRLAGRADMSKVSATLKSKLAL